MNRTTIQRSEEEIAEIKRHKYFLSEKAGHDVGWEAAEKDWDARYGEQFRRQHGEPDSNGGFLDRLLSKVGVRPK